MKNGKSPGTDSITVELLKPGAEFSIKKMNYENELFYDGFQCAVEDERRRKGWMLRNPTPTLRKKELLAKCTNIHKRKLLS